MYLFQDDRMSCTNALAHAYLDEGRLRYHSCMCSCCHTTPAGRHYTDNFEPVSSVPFDDSFEKNVNSVHQIKGINFINILKCPFSRLLTFADFIAAVSLSSFLYC